MLHFNKIRNFWSLGGNDIVRILEKVMQLNANCTLKFSKKQKFKLYYIQAT